MGSKIVLKNTLSKSAIKGGKVQIKKEIENRKGGTVVALILGIMLAGYIKRMALGKRIEKKEANHIADLLFDDFKELAKEIKPDSTMAEIEANIAKKIKEMDKETQQALLTLIS